MKRVVNKLTKILQKNGIKVQFVNRKQVRVDGTKCSGYFDENKRLIKIAVNRPKEQWVSVLLHEYCHFEQWQEDLKIWSDTIIENGDGALETVLASFNNEIHLSPKKIEDYLHKSAILEKDCEIRVLQKIDEFNLPIDKKHYAQCANSYIAFYYAMKKTKSWYDIPPYEFDEIINMMPTRIKGINHKNLGNKLTKLYKKHCIIKD